MKVAFWKQETSKTTPLVTFVSKAISKSNFPVCSHQLWNASFQKFFFGNFDSCCGKNPMCTLNACASSSATTDCVHVLSVYIVSLLRHATAVASISRSNEGRVLSIVSKCCTVKWCWLKWLAKLNIVAYFYTECDQLGWKQTMEYLQALSYITCHISHTLVIATSFVDFTFCAVFITWIA